VNRDLSDAAAVAIASPDAVALSGKIFNYHSFD
jgi:hypothetical protein